MGQIPLLQELAIIAVVSVFVTVLLARLKLPTVAGLLAAGAVVGPFGLHLTSSAHAIELLAEVGVVLLLFSIGLEFSLARLRDVMKQAALGGTLQVVLTTAVVAGIALALDQPFGRSVFLGFVFALSSTAIVLRTLAEHGELEAPHGRFIVGTLIFQDLCVVPMVLIVPLLADTSGSPWFAVAGALGRAAAMVVGTIVVARFVVPRLLRWVDAEGSREIFLLAIIGLCIGTAWLTSLAGLSLALGAFLGGMVVAGTEYGHRAMGDILPLRDAFVSLFFVSLGMLFDVRVVMSQPALVVLFLAGFLVLKAGLATLAALLIRFPARVARVSGIGLAQFGEFGFVLTQIAVAHHVIDNTQVAPLLAAGIVSMFVTPLLLRMAPHFTAGERLLAPLERLLGVPAIDEADEKRTLVDHVILVGYGLAGQLTARALAACDIPFVVIDLHADAVRAGKAEGLPVYHGDATSREVLSHAHIETARLVVVMINDYNALHRAIETMRRANSTIPIVARTRYLPDVDRLMQLGVRVVIASELEAAAALVRRTLRFVGIPDAEIGQRIRDVNDHVKSLTRTGMGVESRLRTEV